MLRTHAQHAANILSICCRWQSRDPVGPQNERHGKAERSRTAEPLGLPLSLCHRRGRCGRTHLRGAHRRHHRGVVAQRLQRLPCDAAGCRHVAGLTACRGGLLRVPRHAASLVPRPGHAHGALGDDRPRRARPTHRREHRRLLRRECLGPDPDSTCLECHDPNRTGTSRSPSPSTMPSMPRETARASRVTCGPRISRTRRSRTR